MGAYTSRGIDNASLMDQLMKHEQRSMGDIERAMRLVDRGDYFEEKNPRAYMDLAFRSGSIHLSAPSIYIDVLYNLDLEPGQHFLNIGSGSGYLNTVVGLILGYTGINHGIEVVEQNVKFARRRLSAFLASSDAPLERDFCVPQYTHGNIFDIVVPPNPTARSRHSSNSSNSSDDVGGHGDELENQQPNGFLLETAATGVGQLDQFSSNVPDIQETEQPAQMPSIEDPQKDLVTEKVHIEEPPVIDLSSMTQDQLQNTVMASWRTYDRIYVGGAVRNKAYLWCILRLLKVGGILVAPVRDELVKIVRISKDTIVRKDLLSVSFVSLIVPGRNVARDSPPYFQNEVPRLTVLCNQLLRTTLREIINTRHGGAPSLGYLEEIVEKTMYKRKRMEPVSQSTVPTEMGPQTTESGSNLSESTTEDTMTDEDGHSSGPDSSDERSDGSHASGVGGRQISSSESEEPDVEYQGGMARILHHFIQRTHRGLIRASPPPDQGSDHELFVNVSDEQNDSSIEFRIATEPVEDNENNTGNSTNDNEPRSRIIRISGGPASPENRANRRRNIRQRSRQVYHPPSYSYREEMMKIMTEELMLPNYFINTVMSL